MNKLEKTSDAEDFVEISQSVARFVYRDQGRWEELLALFQPGATLWITWYQGSVEGFVEGSKAMAAKGAGRSRHLIGLPVVEIKGDRALSETDVQICVRIPFAGGEADLVSFARFLDRFERTKDGTWRIARRTAVYERDRLDPVGPVPGFAEAYAAAGFERFPAPARHLAGALASVGQPLAGDILEAGSAAEAGFLEEERTWLRDGVRN